MRWVSDCRASARIQANTLGGDTTLTTGFGLGVHRRHRDDQESPCHKVSLAMSVSLPREPLDGREART